MIGVKMLLTTIYSNNVLSDSVQRGSILGIVILVKRSMKSEDNLRNKVECRVSMSAGCIDVETGCTSIFNTSVFSWSHGATSRCATFIFLRTWVREERNKALTNLQACGRLLFKG